MEAIQKYFPSSLSFHRSVRLGIHVGAHPFWTGDERKMTTAENSTVNPTSEDQVFALGLDEQSYLKLQTPQFTRLAETLR